MRCPIISAKYLLIAIAIYALSPHCLKVRSFSEEIKLEQKMPLVRDSLFVLVEKFGRIEGEAASCEIITDTNLIDSIIIVVNGIGTKYDNSETAEIYSICRNDTMFIIASYYEPGYNYPAKECSDYSQSIKKMANAPTESLFRVNAAVLRKPENTTIFYADNLAGQ